MPSDDYGLAPHRTGNYRTYGYDQNYLTKPRPGIAIYGNKGSGAMDNRTGVLIHAGTHSRWSVGCIVLHNGGTNGTSRGLGVYRFPMMESVNTLLRFFEIIHRFAGTEALPLFAKIPRLKMMIKEEFSE